MRDGCRDGVLLNGKYEVLKSLNHGAFGMVVLAEDITSGDLVAVKSILRPGFSHAEESTVTVDEMSQELVCHSRLGSHPNIVRLLDDFEHGPHSFLVLEYCSTGDLFDITRRRLDTYDFIPTCYARELIFKLIDAVEYIHSKGVYHRDIKLENVFVTELGEIKLGDFGLATMDDISHESAVGSQAYMAPEQYSPTSAGYSPEKADIWAIGICILVILFGHTPFQTPAYKEDKVFANFVLDKHSLLDIYPRLTLDAFEVLVHALTLDPEKRSLAGMRKALDRVFTFTIYEELYEELRRDEAQCSDLDCESPESDAQAPPLNGYPSKTQKSTDLVPLFERVRNLSIGSHQVHQMQNSCAVDVESAEHGNQLAETRQRHERNGQVRAAEAAGNLFGDRMVFSGASSLADLGASVPEVPALIPDSDLGASLMSLITPGSHIQASGLHPEPARDARSVPRSGIQRIPSLSVVFGTSAGKGAKSWNDLWDEEVEALSVPNLEEHRQERVSVAKELRVQRVGTGSELRRVSETPTASLASSQKKNWFNQSNGPACGVDIVDEYDGFCLVDHPHRQSPPRERNFAMCRQDILDRWAALGERRRAGKGVSSAAPIATNYVGNWRSGLGLGKAAVDSSVSPGKVNIRHVGNWRTGTGFDRPGKGYAAKPMDFTEKVAHHDSGDDIVDLDWVCG